MDAGRNAGGRLTERKGAGAARGCLAALLLLTLLMQGCAYGIYEDKRLFDTISADSTMATKIKTSILTDSLSAGLSVSVYCYFGKVFIVGDVPLEKRDKVEEIAWRAKPASVTCHWFDPVEGPGGGSNVAVSLALRSAFISAKGLSSTRIDTEVNDGRVVLLGVVEDEREERIAIGAAEKVKGVTLVTSYLFTPKRIVPGAEEGGPVASGASWGRGGMEEPGGEARDLPPSPGPAPEAAAPPAKKPVAKEAAKKESKKETKKKETAKKKETGKKETKKEAAKKETKKKDAAKKTTTKKDAAKKETTKTKSATKTSSAAKKPAAAPKAQARSAPRVEPAAPQPAYQPVPEPVMIPAPAPVSPSSPPVPRYSEVPG
ncbi:MAG: BON domain-containing protein [Desulfovibrio sp.]|jgi:hyperosmotically inducible protein|nr:BON domain-containing protein [Desulfovibrio sp.]